MMWVCWKMFDSDATKFLYSAINRFKWKQNPNNYETHSQA